MELKPAPDILKSIQLLPGIQSGGEGTAGFFVRGGSADQNLILLDEAVVYNASHLFGFFSVFNSDAIKNIEISKGSMPANYGGRLSSVLDINMKDGNNKKYEADGGIGLLSSRLTIQGPVQKEKSSFRVLIKTRSLGTHNIVINLNQGLDREFFEDEIRWLILMGTSELDQNKLVKIGILAYMEDCGLV